MNLSPHMTHEPKLLEEGIYGTQKRVPMRTCSGCRTSVPQHEVLRVGAFEGRLAPDLARRLPGRGAWVHPNYGCLEKACRSGFARSLKEKVQADAPTLAKLFLHQLSARVHGLLLASHRTRQLAVGRDAVSDSVTKGMAKVMMVATDMARSNEMVAMARANDIPLLRFATKEELGALLSRQDVATLAILEASLGAEIAEAVSCAASFDPASAGTNESQTSTVTKGPREPEPSQVDAEGGPL